MEDVGKPFFIDLPGASDRHRMRRDVPRNRAAGGGEAVIFDPHRGNENRARSDKGVVADVAVEFIDPIVIGDDGAATDVHPIAEAGVAEVREVRAFAADPEFDVLEAH